MQSNAWLAGIFALVVAGIIAVIVVDRNPVPSVPASPPIEKPRDDLPGQFMASLTRDLETAKAAGKSQEKIQQLAGIMEQATRELTSNNVDLGSFNPQRFSWYNRLLAVGSRKSIELATVLREQEARRLEAAVAKYLSDGDNTGKSATQRVMEAKTAADIDPIIRQLKDFTESAPTREASESTVRKELLCLLDFANSWQLQLAQRAAGQSQLALKTLQSIAQYHKIPRWLDRSVFLREIEVASRAAGKIPLEEIEPRIAEIANQALRATTSEEFDKLLLAGGKLHESMGNDDLLRIPFSQLNEFLKNLQNAIIALERHDTATLRSLLTLLESHHPDFDRHLGVPRTHLLRRVHELRQAADRNIAVPAAKTSAAPPETVIAKMVDMDAIQPHLDELKDSCVGLEPMGTPNWIMIQMRLDLFSKTAAQLKAGQGMDRAVFENPLDPTVPQLRELQRQLDLLCMNIAFAGESGLIPTAQESAEDYANRLRVKLAEKQNWELLRTLATACQAVRTQSPVISLEERQALDSFVYGMRQENDAKDFRTATMAYQSVLTNSSKLIPPAQVGARLENLRQNHPKEYESGIDDALNLNKGESRVLPGARPKQLVWAIPARKPL